MLKDCTTPRRRKGDEILVAATDLHLASMAKKQNVGDMAFKRDTFGARPIGGSYGQRLEPQAKAYRAGSADRQVTRPTEGS